MLHGIVSAACAAVLLVSSAAVAAQGHQHMAMGAKIELGATAAFAPDGRLWVVSSRGDYLWLRHSEDFGQHFSAPIVVNPEPEKISASGENRPKLAFGTRGEIYVSWTAPLPTPYTGRIRFARSVDGGAHFDPPITVHHDPDEITHRFDSLAVDGAGRVLVTWIDKRDLVAAEARGETYPGAAVYYAWSTDRGGSFELERKLADHSCECCRIALARTPDGGLGAFWRAVYDGDVRDHAFAEMHYGTEDPKPAQVTRTGWRIEGCPHHGPGLAIDQAGRAHGVWFSAKDDQPTIWYGQLQAGQAPRHLQKMAGQGAAHADIAVAGNDVWVVWNQFDTEGTRLMLRRSRDGGEHFGEPACLAVSHGATGSPQLLRWRERTLVAWSTADGLRVVAVEDSK